jgi:tetratricopeptide (TPR) repeat protein
VSLSRNPRNPDRQDSNLLHFTNRIHELERLKELLEAKGSLTSRTPVLAYHGAGGMGKTWLLERLKKVAQTEYRLPSAYLRFDDGSGAPYLHDPSKALYQLRSQIGGDAPRFDLAYAMYRYKLGDTSRPVLEGEATFATVMEFVVKSVKIATQVDKWGELIASMGEKGFGRLAQKFRDSAAGQRLLERAGYEDYVGLCRKDAQQIYPELTERLAQDWSERLPRREFETGVLNSASRATVFLDGMEWFPKGPRFSGRPSDQWVRELCWLADGVLFVLAGQNSLDWADQQAEWTEVLEQKELQGLEREDALSYLRLRQVGQGFEEAILRASQEHGRFHSLSLGWCADIVEQDPEAKPASLNLRPADWQMLTERFLLALRSEGERRAIERLALLPRFDERAALSVLRDEGVEQKAAWARLRRYTFMERVHEGWWALRPQARLALMRTLEQRGAEETRTARENWAVYWLALSKHNLDDGGELSWVQRWFLEPEGALVAWSQLAESLCLGLRMHDHEKILRWWAGTFLESTPARTAIEALALNVFAAELRRSTQGAIGGNLRRAIACYEAALEVYREATFPEDWAMTLNGLGSAYQELPDGNRNQNLRQAIVYYEKALRIYTETEFPEGWSQTQHNLGNAYVSLPDGDRIGSLNRAIACYVAALRVGTKSASSVEWAHTQNSLGTAHLKLALERPEADATSNLKQAINCFQGALRVFFEEGSSFADWAMAQKNLGFAYSNLSDRDQTGNLRNAIVCYEYALRVYEKDSFPTDWAMTQFALGVAYEDLEASDRSSGLHLRKALEYLENSLRVFTPQAFPSDHADSMAARDRVLLKLRAIEDDVRRPS